VTENDKYDDIAVRYALRDLTTLDRASALVPKRRVVVQAGGCLGVFPRHLAKTFETVYTFEPEPRLFRVLSVVVTDVNVVKFQAALGAAPDFVRTVLARRDGDKTRTAHAGVTHVQPGGRIPVMRLDSLDLPVLDLLVLDIEGYELNALHGATVTISRCRPVVMLEVTELSTHVGHSPEDVRNYMKAMEYRLVERVNSDEIYVPMENK